MMDDQLEKNIAAIKYNESLENPTYKIRAQHVNVGVGKLILENPLHIGRGCWFDLTGNIKIGKYSEISDDTKIFTHKHHWRHSRGRRKDIQRIEAIDLVIGQDVFIGANSIIVTVRSIGAGAVIGTGSVLTKDVAPYEIWAGNPAIKIGERND